MSISFLRGCIRRVFSTLSGFALLIVLTAPSCAQERDVKSKEPAAEKSAPAKTETSADQSTIEKTAEAKPDPLALPEKGDAATYLAFIEALQKYEPTDIVSDADYKAYLIKSQNLLLEAAKRGLAQKPDEQETVSLVETKIVAIINLFYLGELKSPREAITILEGYADDERELVASFSKSFLKRVKLTILETLSREERIALVEEIVRPVEKTGASRFNFGQLIKMGEQIEAAASKEEIIAFYQRIAKLARQSSDENIVSIAEKLEGVARRHDLPGKTMELFGKTATGDEFNWKAYKGKVVLVDFWATWCGVCVQEIPDLKAHYQQYHEKGFEVVGVNLDENLFDLESFVAKEKLPWVNIVIPEAGIGEEKTHPLATRYGVMLLPTNVLIDRDGKVVALNVHGTDLEAQLEKLLGKPKSE